MEDDADSREATPASLALQPLPTGISPEICPTNLELSLGLLSLEELMRGQPAADGPQGRGLRASQVLEKSLHNRVASLLPPVSSGQQQGAIIGHGLGPCLQVPLMREPSPLCIFLPLEPCFPYQVKPHTQQLSPSRSAGWT